MNCKQLDELLPLYAGRDLDEKRARLVSEHIQICSACARVAGEYRDAVELTQHFAPPVFSDPVYASVRRQVMQQIDEPTTPLLPQLFASWFRPRVAWAVAGALIIAFGFFALYVVVNRTTDVQPVAETHPKIIEHPGSTATPGTTNPANAGTTWKPTEDKGKVIRRFVNRTPKARDSSLRTASVSRRLRDPEATNSLPARDAAPGESPLRVEIQTQNPNIRIIWFSQQSTKPALPNSKGI
ncbi:MAG TPA: zf-HC2 domain-containing protein [Pyrinomonadaceae bacterium]|nr:zf-HC2 domain-containing protein [Pyrinomonadaceae bacterium]